MSSSAGGLFKIGKKGSNSSDNGLYIREDYGNVGIKKYPTGYALDVNGAINANKLYINDSKIIMWDNDGSNVSFNTGNVGIGSTNPTVSLDISAVDAIRIPVGDGSERPTVPTQGMIRYNTSDNQFEGYSGSTWQGLGGVISTDQNTKITADNNGDLLFYTKDGTNDASVERLKIDANGDFIWTSSGNIGIGSTSPVVSLDISASDAIRIPVGDGSERPSAPTRGMIRYNTDDNQFEGYSGSTWQGLGGVISTDQNTKITADNSGDLIFYTKDGTNDVSVERLKIDDDGNLIWSGNDINLGTGIATNNSTGFILTINNQGLIERTTSTVDVALSGGGGSSGSSDGGAEEFVSNVYIQALQGGNLDVSTSTIIDINQGAGVFAGGVSTANDFELIENLIFTDSSNANNVYTTQHNLKSDSNFKVIFDNNYQYGTIFSIDRGLSLNSTADGIDTESLFIIASNQNGTGGARIGIGQDISGSQLTYPVEIKGNTLIHDNLNVSGTFTSSGDTNASGDLYFTQSNPTIKANIGSLTLSSEYSCIVQLDYNNNNPANNNNLIGEFIVRNGEGNDVFNVIESGNTTIGGTLNVSGVLTLDTISDLKTYVEDISSDLANLSQNQLVNTDDSTDTFGIDTDGSLSHKVSGSEVFGVASSGNTTIGGTLDVTGNITGTLATSAQPNITSVGTLSSLNVSGNTTIDGSLNVSNIISSENSSYLTKYTKKSTFFFGHAHGNRTLNGVSDRAMKFYKLFTVTNSFRLVLYAKITGTWLSEPHFFDLIIRCNTEDSTNPINVTMKPSSQYLGTNNYNLFSNGGGRKWDIIFVEEDTGNTYKDVHCYFVDLISYPAMNIESEIICYGHNGTITTYNHGDYTYDTTGDENRETWDDRITNYISVVTTNDPDYTSGSVHETNSVYDYLDANNCIFQTDQSGNVGIGTMVPSSKLDVNGSVIISEEVGTAATASGGSLTLIHNDYADGSTGGTSSIVFKSKIESNIDYGYIEYRDDYDYTIPLDENGSQTQDNDQSILILGTANDQSDFRRRDRIALMPGNNGDGYVGINTTDPSTTLDVSGNANISGNTTINNGSLTINNAPVDTSVNNRTGTTTHTDFNQSIIFSNDNYRHYYIGIFGDSTNNNNVLAFGSSGGGEPNPNILFTMDANGSIAMPDTLTIGGNVGIAGDTTISGAATVGGLDVAQGETIQTWLYENNSTSTRSMYLQAPAGDGNEPFEFHTNNAYSFYADDTEGIHIGTAGDLFCRKNLTVDIGNLGIRTTTPSYPIHVVDESTTLNSSNLLIVMEATNVTANNRHPLFGFAFWGDDNLTLQRRDDSSNFGSRETWEGDFTGQHRNIFHKKVENIDPLVGLIVISNGEYCNIFDLKENVNVNESLPIVKLSEHSNDRKVFGVISNMEDIEDSGNRRYGEGGILSFSYNTNIYDKRLYINSVGEGGIWVTNINGPIENGEYITSSTIPGYGCRQNDDLLHNYTVAKITCDCEFGLEKIGKTTLKFKTMGDKKYIDYDTSGNLQFENVVDASGNHVFDYKYKTRFLLSDGTEITLEEYNQNIDNGIDVYIACFVGCTYHCG